MANREVIEELSKDMRRGVLRLVSLPELLRLADEHQMEIPARDLFAGDKKYKIGLIEAIINYEYARQGRGGYNDHRLR